MVCNSMKAGEVEAEITEARAAYFHAADEVLYRLHRQLGEGSEVLRSLLTRHPKNVDNSCDIRPDKD